MAETEKGHPEDPSGDTSSLLGPVTFRPGLLIVLAFLTATVAVVGYRLSRDAGVRQVAGLTREAMRLFGAWPKGPEGFPSISPEEAEARVAELSGARIPLPRREGEVLFHEVSRERVGRRHAAAVRMTCLQEPCLLLVARQEALFGAPSFPPAVFPGVSFLPGESGGMSYVFWNRGGVLFCLVSSRDLTHTFDLVRRYFT